MCNTAEERASQFQASVPFGLHQKLAIMPSLVAASAGPASAHKQYMHVLVTASVRHNANSGVSPIQSWCTHRAHAAAAAAATLNIATRVLTAQQAPFGVIRDAACNNHCQAKPSKATATPMTKQDRKAPTCIEFRTLSHHQNHILDRRAVCHASCSEQGLCLTRIATHTTYNMLVNKHQAVMTDSSCGAADVQHYLRREPPCTVRRPKPCGHPSTAKAAVLGGAAAGTAACCLLLAHNASYHRQPAAGPQPGTTDSCAARTGLLPATGPQCRAPLG